MLFCNFPLVFSIKFVTFATKFCFSLVCFEGSIALPKYTRNESFKIWRNISRFRKKYS